MTDPGISDAELCRIEARHPPASQGWSFRQIGENPLIRDVEISVDHPMDVPRLCAEIRRLQVEVERLSLVMKAAARTGAVVVDLSHAHEREVGGAVEMD